MRSVCLRRRSIARFGTHFSVAVVAESLPRAATKFEEASCPPKPADSDALRSAILASCRGEVVAQARKPYGGLYPICNVGRAFDVLSSTAMPAERSPKS